MVCYCWLVVYYAHLFIMTSVHFAHLCMSCYYDRIVRCARTSYVGANNIIRTKNLSLSCPPKFVRLEPPLCISMIYIIVLGLQKHILIEQCIAYCRNDKIKFIARIFCKYANEKCSK